VRSREIGHCLIDLGEVNVGFPLLEGSECIAFPSQRLTLEVKHKEGFMKLPGVREGQSGLAQASSWR
jgi:hypothetical protein